MKRGFSPVWSLLRGIGGISLICCGLDILYFCVSTQYYFSPRLLLSNSQCMQAPVFPQGTLHTLSDGSCRKSWAR